MRPAQPQLGRVYLVGAGPGDPELLTVKASRLLREADGVLHDDLVSAEIVGLAGPQAIVVNVGKRCGRKGITQVEINRVMILFAKAGVNVVRLKSGDPLIFGRLNEEVDALEAAGVPYEVVPGITAGFAAAAALGVSLTDRRTSSRVLILSGHRAAANQDSQQADAWLEAGRADATLIIYMPGPDLGSLREKLRGAGVSLATPCVVISSVSTAAQRVTRTTLAGLSSLAGIEAPAILLVGRSLERANRSVLDRLSVGGAGSDPAEQTAVDFVGDPRQNRIDRRA
ncbi:MAG: uroporphyrinogen-III C-methyltransferase [Candidatus Acidiferrales bacterium]